MHTKSHTHPFPTPPQVTVTWAEPKRSDAAQEQVKSIYVGQLPDSVDEHKLKNLFAAYGQVRLLICMAASHKETLHTAMATCMMLVLKNELGVDQKVRHSFRHTYIPYIHYTGTWTSFFSS